MKTIGRSRFAFASDACRSRPLRPGMRRSVTMQAIPSRGGRSRYSCADANASTWKPAARNWRASARRTDASSSMTNTEPERMVAELDAGIAWTAADAEDRPQLYGTRLQVSDRAAVSAIADSPPVPLVRAQAPSNGARLALARPAAGQLTLRQHQAVRHRPLLLPQETIPDAGEGLDD